MLVIIKGREGQQPNEVVEATVGRAKSMRDGAGTRAHPRKNKRRKGSVHSARLCSASRCVHSSTSRLSSSIKRCHCKWQCGKIIDRTL